MKQNKSNYWNNIAGNFAIFMTLLLGVSLNAETANVCSVNSIVEEASQVEITSETAKCVIALLEALVQEEDRNASLAAKICYEKIKNGLPITAQELQELLSEIIEYAEETNLVKTDVRAPRPGAENLVVGIGACDIGGVLTALRAVRNQLDRCCGTIQGELELLIELINGIAIDLTITATSFQTLVETFSIFEQSVTDLENTVTVLINIVDEFSASSTVIISLLQGTFTAIDACCSSINAQFINTWTILDAGFESTATILDAGFNSTFTSFEATWTILEDIKNSVTGCQCFSEFQQTWTILESLQNSFTTTDCACISEFQQTWTILANLSLSVTAQTCTFTAEFLQTWTILDAGFNETFTDFQATFTVLEAGFQETFSLIQNLSSPGFVTVFGDEIVASRQDLISIQFPYGVSTYDTVSSTVSGGSVTSANSMAVISSGTNPTGAAQLQSKRALRYRSGHEAYVYFSALFNTGGVANSTQWIGLLDATNGVAVGYNGTGFSVLYRNNGVDTVIPQASFNLDPLDGTGPSGFTLNPQTLNVYRIGYGWLGASPIVYQVLGANGEWIPFHQIISNNTVLTPIFSNPMIPITAQVTKTSGVLNITLSTASWNAGILAQPSNASSRYFAAQSLITTITGSGTPSEQHLLTVRNKTTFQGQANKISVRISLVSGSNNRVSLDTNTTIRIRKSAVVNSTSFTSVDLANSVMEFSTAGIYQVGTGILQLAFALDTQYTIDQLAFLPGNEFYLEVLPGETVTITGQQQGSSPSEVYVSLSWEELF